MRFLDMVQGPKDLEAGGMRSGRLAGEMATDRDRAPRLISRLNGWRIRPSSKGGRITDFGAKPMVIDGPFAETKELIGGRSLIRARSREKERR